MLKIDPTLSIPEEEFSVSFVHASGPGGQNINKTASAVQLRFDVQGSPSLSREVKDRLKHLAGRRMTRAGILLIEARRYRTQEKNRADAFLRLCALIQKALIPPEERRPTRPTSSSQLKRLDSKKHRSVVKQRRQRMPDAED